MKFVISTTVAVCNIVRPTLLCRLWCKTSLSQLSSWEINKISWLSGVTFCM